MDKKARVRFKISQEAARIFVEEGIEDYKSAKQKAAERLRLPTNVNLPRDEEISRAIEEYHRIYRSNTQASHIKKLRELALKAMRFLEAFYPRLTGAVLEGTAGPHSPIVLQLFMRTSEELIVKLINAKISYSERKHLYSDRNGNTIELPSIEIQTDQTLIRLKLFPDGQRPVRFLKHRLLLMSADINQVRQILNLNCR